LHTEPPTPRLYSTETTVIAAHDSIVRTIDSGDVCALALLDLSSAFDTVDHETLMHVLQQRVGVEGPALTWFGSYLSDRTQAFHHNTQQCWLGYRSQPPLHRSAFRMLP